MSRIILFVELHNNLKYNVIRNNKKARNALQIKTSYIKPQGNKILQTDVLNRTNNIKFNSLYLQRKLGDLTVSSNKMFVVPTGQIGRASCRERV